MALRLGMAAICVFAAAVGCSGCSNASAPPAETAAAPPAGPVVEPPITRNVPAATITQSSVLQSFDASGLLRAAEPGWHAEKNAPYPQWVQIEFNEPRTINRVSLLPQDTYAARGPKQIDVEASDDGKAWKPVVSIADACGSGENTWRAFGVQPGVEARQVRLVVHSNCGDPDYLTLRGLKFE